MYFSNNFTKIRKLFFKGLIFLLPFSITLTLFSFFFNLIHHWLAPLREALVFLKLSFLLAIPYSDILLAISFIILIGFLLETIALRPFLHIGENLFSKIPVVKSIYPGIKQLIHAFSSHDNNSFNTVVLVQFPLQGVYSIGFLTREVPHQMLCKDNKKYINIYIPMTPNPTHGFFIMVPEGEYIVTDLTRQEATSLIISGGILQPDRYCKTN
ncbi:DUF502 domain-containing protein [Candidatus Dependentiae bacterium]|nr:DUF502 domain-containing protein [Candidatus Dependentiae bacterium]